MGTSSLVLVALLTACTVDVDLATTEQALTVRRTDGHDDLWSEADKRNLTYCIDDSFGWATEHASRMLAQAALEWERRADVDFIHVVSEDGAECTNRNGHVKFNVHMVRDQSYAARAFYPSTPREGRELLVNVGTLGNSPAGLVDVFGHELGHALGFRHEQVQLKIYGCEEGGDYRGVTSYDNASIMHYVQCAGRYRFAHWTKRDRLGAAALYGVGERPQRDREWRTANGQRVIWFLHDAMETNAGVAERPGRQILGMGDFDGDGVMDIAWRNDATTQIGSWLMSEAGDIAGEEISGALATDVSVQAIRDFNGDGVADMVWRSPIGTVWMWLFSNRDQGRAQAIELGTVGTDWSPRISTAMCAPRFCGGTARDS
jgi:hypothetical protein